MGCSPARLRYPWDSADKDTAVGCHALLQGIFPTHHALLQGIFPTQGSNPGLLHCTRFLYHRAMEGTIGAHRAPPNPRAKQNKFDLFPAPQYSQEHPLPGNLDSLGQQSIPGLEGGMESPAFQTRLVIKLGRRRSPPTVSVRGLFLLD